MQIESIAQCRNECSISNLCSLFILFFFFFWTHGKRFIKWWKQVKWNRWFDMHWIIIYEFMKYRTWNTKTIFFKCSHRLIWIISNFSHSVDITHSLHHPIHRHIRIYHLKMEQVLTVIRLTHNPFRAHINIPVAYEKKH